MATLRTHLLAYAKRLSFDAVCFIETKGTKNMKREYMVIWNREGLEPKFVLLEPKRAKKVNWTGQRTKRFSILAVPKGNTRTIY